MTATLKRHDGGGILKPRGKFYIYISISPSPSFFPHSACLLSDSYCCLIFCGRTGQDIT